MMLFQDLGLLILFLGRVIAEVPDPEQDLVQMAEAASVVVGNYFYTVGGYTTFNVPDGFPFGTKSATSERARVVSSNDHLRRIDLSRPFTVSKIDTVREKSIALSDQVPRMRSGTMWAHNTTIYLGPSDLEVYPPLRNGTWINETRRMPSQGIWTYDTAKPDAEWVKLSGLGDNGTFNPVIDGSVAYLDGIAYIMGGTYGLTTTLKNPDGTPLTLGLGRTRGGKLSSLYKLDSERNVGTNESSSVGHVDSGRMVAIKGVGKKGILVYIGGLNSEGSYNDMSLVRVYDIASGAWGAQEATSVNDDDPHDRKDFCAVAMSAQDRSSHQIYFYGGLSDDSGTSHSLDDVWILTLPSFQFIKVGNSHEAARISGTCSVISPQYLLAYRGLSRVAGDTEPERYSSLGDASLALLDLTDLKWKTEYTPANASTMYRVPRKVIEVIGGGETGKAKTHTPKYGFDSEFLAKIFGGSYSSDGSWDSWDDSSPKNGMVIGLSVAGTVVSLLSIAGMASYFRRRQRKKLLLLVKELGPKPGRVQEADGNMVALVKYELDGSRPVIYEIGSG